MVSKMIFIIIVLYNKMVYEIDSLSIFEEFFKDKKAEIIVCDNSCMKIVSENRAYCINRRWIHYIDNEGDNKGISYNYNKALAYIESLEKDDYWVMFSDDDTKFSEEYLQNMYRAVVQGKNKLISGIIPSVSPMRKNVILNTSKNLIKTSGVYRNIYCINSGLTIHSSIIKTIRRYDETLFLDMIDYWLMEELKKKNLNTFLIVEGDILHKFSGIQSQSRTDMMTRFNIFKKDFQRFCVITHKPTSYRLIVLWKRYLNIQIKSVLYVIKNKGGTKQ